MPQQDRVIDQKMSLFEAAKLMAPDSSNTTLRSWIEVGRFCVDDLPVKGVGVVVKPGQTVSFGDPIRFLGGRFRYFFSDRHMIVIEKPLGLLSVATDYEREETLHGLLGKLCFPKTVYPVHRLDRETSGVMVFALSEEGRKGLKDAFEVHAIERTYIAVVEGEMESNSGTWSSYLYEDAHYQVHETKDSSLGKLAVTHYSVLRTHRGMTLLQLNLETGKKHQIRCHCASAGHPVVGDSRYGAQMDPLRRVCLHAHVLGLKHPVTSQQLRFVAPVPARFYKLVPR